jgi:hypothetical protein
MRRLNINEHLRTFIPDSFKRRDAVTFEGVAEGLCGK